MRLGSSCTHKVAPGDQPLATKIPSHSFGVPLGSAQCSISVSFGKSRTLSRSASPRAAAMPLRWWTRFSESDAIAALARNAAPAVECRPQTDLEGDRRCIAGRARIPRNWRTRCAAMGDDIARLNQETAEAEARQRDLLLQMPNLPHAGAPIGADAAANPVVRDVGEKPALAAPRSHIDLGAELGLFDLERAARMSGSAFACYTGPGRAAGAGADQFHARPAHARAWLHGGQPAVCHPRARRSSAPGSCRSSRSSFTGASGTNSTSRRRPRCR